MKNEDKTKEQLIDELAEMHEELAKLRASEAARKRLEEEQALKIGEILMEMRCLTRLQLVRYLQQQREDMHNYRLKHRQKRLGELLIEAGSLKSNYTKLWQNNKRDLSIGLTQRARQLEQNQRLLECHQEP